MAMPPAASINPAIVLTMTPNPVITRNSHDQNDPDCIEPIRSRDRLIGLQDELIGEAQVETTQTRTMARPASPPFIYTMLIAVWDEKDGANRPISRSALATIDRSGGALLLTFGSEDRRNSNKVRSGTRSLDRSIER
jgi:hypothetical protein